MRLLGRWFGADVDWALRRVGGDGRTGRQPPPQQQQQLLSQPSARRLIGFTAPLPLSHLAPFRNAYAKRDWQLEETATLEQRQILRGWSVLLARVAWKTKRQMVMPCVPRTRTQDLWLRMLLCCLAACAVATD